MNHNKYLREKTREIRKSLEASPLPQDQVASTTSKLRKKRSAYSKASEKRKEAESLIKENRKELARKKKEFTKAWDAQKPAISTSNLVRKFREQSREFCDPMLENSMRLIGLLTAVGYANDEIQKGIDKEGDMRISEMEMSTIGQKMMRLKMIQLAAKSMELDDALLERILGIQVAKDFGGHQLSPAASAPPIKRNNTTKQVKVNEKKESLFSAKRHKKARS